MNGWTKAFGIIEMIAAVIFIIAVILAKFDDMAIAAISLDDFFANDTCKLLTEVAGGVAIVGGLGSIVTGSKSRSTFNCVLGALVALIGAVFLMAAAGEIQWVESNVDLFLTVLFAITAIVAIAFTASRKRYVGIIVFIILFFLIVVLKGRDFDGKIVEILGHGFPLYCFASDMFMPVVGAILLFFIGLFVVLYAIREAKVAAAAVAAAKESEETPVEESEEPKEETPAVVTEEEKPAEPAPAAVVEETPADPAPVEETPAEEEIPEMPKVMSSQDAAAEAAAVKAENEERLSEQPAPAEETPAEEEKPAEPAPVEEAPAEQPAVAGAAVAVDEDEGENIPEEDSSEIDSGDDDYMLSLEDLGLEPDTPETFVRRAAWNKGLRCRRDYGKYKIPVAFVKGKVAVFVDGEVPMTSKDETLAKEGWTVLHFSEADITDGVAEAEVIVKAVKENTRAMKKKRKSTKR
ncbi:transcription termination factor Rho [Methanoculleus sp. CAG:1088]|nr:transcription termination factor Rho [Methanoculleus sp. CAG:1088]